MRPILYIASFIKKNQTTKNTRKKTKAMEAATPRFLLAVEKFIVVEKQPQSYE